MIIANELILEKNAQRTLSYLKDNEHQLVYKLSLLSKTITKPDLFISEHQQVLDEVKEVFEKQYGELKLNFKKIKLKNIVQRMDIISFTVRNLIETLSDLNDTDAIFSITKILYKVAKYSTYYIKNSDKIKESLKNACINQLNATYVDSLMILTDKYYKENKLHDALAYVNEAYIISYQVNYNKLDQILLNKAICHGYFSAIQIKKNQLSEAEFSLLTAESFFKKCKGTSGFHKTNCKNLANEFHRLGNLIKAIEWYTKANNHVKDTQDKAINTIIAELKNKHLTGIKDLIKSHESENLKFSLDENRPILVIEFNRNFKSNCIQVFFKNIGVSLVDNFLKINIYTINVDQLTIQLPKLENAIREHNEFLKKSTTQPTQANLTPASTSKPNTLQESSYVTLTENFSSPKIKKRGPAKESPDATAQQNPITKLSESSQTNEKIFFGSKYQMYKIHPLQGSGIPLGTYYGYYNSANAGSIDQKTHDHHEKVLEKGDLVSSGPGVVFVRGKGEDQFKTAISSNTFHGNFRMWSNKVEDVILDGKRRVLLAFEIPLTHKTQTKLYQK